MTEFRQPLSKCHRDTKGSTTPPRPADAADVYRASRHYPDRLAVAVDLPLPSVRARAKYIGGLTWMLYRYPHMLSMAPTRAPLAVALRGSLAR